jgi:hypothetical protein
MTEVVTIEPWSPWPLILPGIVIVVGIMASMVGTHFRSKPMREGGYVVFIIGALALGMMTWSLSGLWDTSARKDALVDAGYDSPTFFGSTSASRDDIYRFAWQAIRDGERVHGVLRALGGDRWELREIPG